MGKITRMVAVLVMAVSLTLGSGCAWFQSVDKAGLAYNVGKYGTVAYMQAGKGKLPPSFQDAVTQVWEGFRDNADQVTAENIAGFPAMIKLKIASSGLPASVTVQANALVDKYWADLDKAVGLAGLDDAQLAAVVQALRQGIQDGLNQTNPDDNQPPSK